MIIICSAIGLIVVGVSGMNGMKIMSQSTKAMYEDRLIPNTWIAKVQNNSALSDSYLIELMVTEDEKRNKVLLDLLQVNEEETEMYIKKLDSLDMSKKEEEAFLSYKDMLESYQKLQKQVIDLANNNFNDTAYNLYTTSLNSKVDVINESLNELQSSNQLVAKNISEENENSYQLGMYMMAGIILLALILAAVIGMSIANMIVKPINVLKDLMQKASSGDFSERSSFKGKDEVGSLSTSYNTMAEGMKGLIETLTETSQHLAASSEELSASSEESSRASEHISETIQELAVSSESQMQLMASSAQGVQNINNSTESINVHAQKVSDTAEKTSIHSSKGTENIVEVTKQMQSINTNVNNLSQSIHILETRINEIGDITKVITDISSQTNLLALNAAIEAARAGEQGKGFAVVADEVRKLAEQSAHSAEEITNLINQIQADTKNTTKSMVTAASDVKTGISIVQDTGESFKMIEESVHELVTLFEEVFYALNQLKDNTKVINTSIMEVNSMASESAASTENVSAATEEQVASMEEIAASSSSLSQLANDLQEKIKQFKI